MSEVTNKVVELAKSLLGSPYVWGATGEKCTPTNRKRRMASAKISDVSRTNIEKRCPILKGSAKTCAGCKYEGMDEYDCIGFVNYVNNTCGIKLYGLGATYHWSTKSNFVRQGPIAEMPNVVCCVYQQKEGNCMSHIGFHIGDGVIIHCSGSGEVKYGKITDSGWTHYAIPKGYYTEEELKEAKIVSTHGLTVLKKGMRGNDVFELQVMLNTLGYNCGEPDGTFGSKTDAAVRDFQAKNKISVDGKVGPVTMTLIEKLYDEKTGVKDDEEPPAEEDDAPVEDNSELLEVFEKLQAQLDAIQAQLDEYKHLLNK